MRLRRAGRAHAGGPGTLDAREKFAAAAKHLVLLPPGRHESCHPFDGVTARRRVRAAAAHELALPTCAPGMPWFPRASEARLLEALLRGDRFVHVSGSAGSGKSCMVATVLEQLGRSCNVRLFWMVYHANCGGPAAVELSCEAHCEARFMTLLVEALTRAPFVWPNGATNDACVAAARDALRTAVDKLKRRHRRVLLFLDGVDNATGAPACPLFGVVRRYLFGEGGEVDNHVTGLLVECPNMCVVITSRGLGPGIRGVPVLGSVAPALQFSSDIDVTGLSPEDVSRFWAHAAECAPEQLAAWFSTRGTSREALDRLLSTGGTGKVFYVGPVARAAALLRLASCRQPWAYDYVRAAAPGAPVVAPPRSLCRGGSLSDGCADAYERAFLSLSVGRWRAAHVGFWGHIDGGPDAVDEIRGWLAGTGAVSGSRVFVLHGPAARGKSAVAGALAAHTQDGVPVAAVHFVQSFDRATWDVRTMVLSIAHQLRANGSGGSCGVEGRGTVAMLPPPSDGRSQASWCCGVLMDALRLVPPPERGCCVILVDGVDEACGGAAVQRDILSALAVVSELPVWVRLVLTCRSPDAATQVLTDATLSTAWVLNSKATACLNDIRSRFDSVRERIPSAPVQTVLEVLGAAESPLDVSAVLRAVAARRRLPERDDGAGALAVLESNGLFRVCRDTWLVEPCHNAIFEWARLVADAAKAESFCGFLDRVPLGEQLLVEEDDELACYMREHCSILAGATSLTFVTSSGEEGAVDVAGGLVEDLAGLWFRVFTAERVLELRAGDSNEKEGWLRALGAAVVRAPRAPAPQGCYFVRAEVVGASSSSGTMDGSDGGGVHELCVEVFDAREARLCKLEWTYGYADFAALDTRVRRLRDGRSGGALLPPSDCDRMVDRLSAYLHALTSSSRVNPAVRCELLSFWSNRPTRGASGSGGFDEGLDREDGDLVSAARAVCVVCLAGSRGGKSRTILDEASVVRTCCADVCLSVFVCSALSQCDSGTISVLHVCGSLDASDEDELVEFCRPTSCTAVTGNAAAPPDAVIVAAEGSSDIVARLLSVGVADIVVMGCDSAAFARAAFARHFYSLRACHAVSVGDAYVPCGVCWCDAYVGARDAVELEFPGATRGFELLRCSAAAPWFDEPSRAPQQYREDRGVWCWRVPRPLRRWFDGTWWRPGASSAGDVMGTLFEALCGGSARCIYVCGPAGVGKTHVVREALRRVRDRHVHDAAYFVSCAADPRLSCAVCCEAAFVGLLCAELSGEPVLQQQRSVRSDSLPLLRSALLSVASRVSAHRNVVLVIDGCDAVPMAVLESTLFGSTGVLTRCTGLCAVLTSRRPIDESAPAFGAVGTVQMHVAPFGVEAAVAFFVSCLCPNYTLSEADRAHVEARLRSVRISVLGADDGRKWESLCQHALFASDGGGGRVAGCIAAAADKILRKRQRVSARGQCCALDDSTVTGDLREPASEPFRVTSLGMGRCECGSCEVQASGDEMRRGIDDVHSALRRAIMVDVLDRDRVSWALGMARTAAAKSEQLVDHVRGMAPPVRAVPGIEAYCAFHGRAPRVGAGWHHDTRLWLLNRVRVWLCGPDRVRWLHGDAGVGKTVIATMVGSVYGAAASHFCAYNVEDTRNPELVVASISFQLRVRFPSSYGPPASEMGLRDGETLEALWMRAIVDPMSRVHEAERFGGPVLIVIDALDEAARGSDANNGIADLLLGCRLDRWPVWLKLFVTSRDTTRLRRDFRDHALSIDAAGAENVGDVRVVVEDLLRNVEVVGGGPGEAHARLFMRAEAIDIVVRKAAGIFLYVSYVRDKLLSMPTGIQLDRAFFADLPRDVRDIIAQSMRRMRDVLPGRSLDPMRPLFEVIVAAMEPLTFEMLAVAARLSDRDARTANRAIGISGLFRYLPGGELQPFHKVVVDWLEDSARGRARRSRGHTALFQWTRDRLFVDAGACLCVRGIFVGALERYAFLFVVDHALESDTSTSIVEQFLLVALRDVSYLYGRICCGGLGTLVTQLRHILESGASMKPIVPFVQWVCDTGSLLKTNLALSGGDAMSGRHGGSVAAAVRSWFEREVGAAFVLSDGLWHHDDSHVQVVFRGHATEGVECIAVTPDGANLFDGGADGRLCVWDTVSGVSMRAPFVFDTRVLSVAVRKNGDCLVGCDNGTIFVCDVVTGALRSITCSSAEPIRAISPNGQYFAAMGAVSILGGSVSDVTGARVFDVIRGEVVAELAFSVSALCFSNDGVLVACASGRATVWQIVPQVKLQEFVDTDAALALSFSPDSKLLVCGGVDRVVRVFHVAQSRLSKAVAELRGHSDFVSCLRFSESGKRLASGSNDKSVRVWDASSWALLAVLQGPSSAVSSVCFIRDENRVACGSGDGTARIWDLPIGAPSSMVTSCRRSCDVKVVCCSLDGSVVAAMVRGGTVAAPVVYIIPTQSSFTTCPAGEYECGSLSNEHESEACGTWSCPACTFANSAVAVCVTCGQSRPGPSWSRHVLRVSGEVFCMCFSPCGDVLVCGHALGDSSMMEVWQPGTCDKRPVRRWVASAGGDDVYAVAVSADGLRRVAAGGDFGSVRVWKSENGELLLSVDVPDDVWALAFSSRNLIAVGGDGLFLHCFDASSGALIWKHSPAEFTDVSYQRLEFSPSGSLLLGGDEDGACKLWKVDSNGGTLFRDIVAHTSAVKASSFSPDEAYVASADASGSVLVSSTASGMCVLAPRLPDGVGGLAWSKCGTKLVVAVSGTVMMSPPTTTVVITALPTGRDAASFSAT